VYKFLSEPDSSVPSLLHPALLEACDEITQLKKRIEGVDRTLMKFVKENEITCRLMKIPGIGCLTATALVALVGNVRRFRSGRSFASFLGLTPRESSTAFQRRLGRISKQGDVYLRTLLIHGARSILAWSRRAKNLDRLRVWALQVETRRGFNKTVVAIANKMARFVWATWRNDRAFVPFESVQSVG
jgi:transposase